MIQTDAASNSIFTSDPSYLIVGDGKVARHFQHYFRLVSVPHFIWSRRSQSSDQLRELAKKCDVLLILISDPQIEPFLKAHPYLQTKPCVHFSGSLVTSLAWGAHPLNTFASQLYELEVYEQTHFICEDTTGNFKTLFPRLKNPLAVVRAEHKSLYHALCVMTGNFTTLLWQKGFHDFKEKLNLDPAVLRPYLRTTVDNLMADPQAALTGPLARRDLPTIKRHLSALEDDAFAVVYEAFVQTQGLEVKS